MDLVHKKFTSRTSAVFPNAIRSCCEKSWTLLPIVAIVFQACSGTSPTGVFLPPPDRFDEQLRTSNAVTVLEIVENTGPVQCQNIDAQFQTYLVKVARLHPAGAAEVGATLSLLVNPSVGTFGVGDEVLAAGSLSPTNAHEELDGFDSRFPLVFVPTWTTSAVIVDENFAESFTNQFNDSVDYSLPNQILSLTTSGLVPSPAYSVRNQAFHSAFAKSRWTTLPKA
jgi:hypothetical protein